MALEQIGLTPAQKTFYQKNGYLVLEGSLFQEKHAAFATPCCFSVGVGIKLASASFKEIFF